LTFFPKLAIIDIHSAYVPMPETWLPLFPLNVVLFPRSALPLHIFEERYKLLVNECVERGTQFGIALARDEGMADIGCSASVSSVTRRYDDGRMDIVVGGERRYRLLHYESGRAPYLLGEVAYIEEPDEAVNGDLASSTIELFNALLVVAYKGTGTLVSSARSEAGLSYVIAQKAGLDLPRRQELLEIPGENARLRMLNDYLTELLPRLKRAGEVQRVVQNDGYI
jgi:ATP-dependent Lon protease